MWGLALRRTDYIFNCIGDSEELDETGYGEDLTHVIREVCQR